MSNEEIKIPETDTKPIRKRTLFHKIVNVFLYIGVVVFAVLVFLFGFSQTQTFRNWLRDFVVETANANLNGKLSIGKIEGTLFTSLLLRNTIVTVENDTLLNAGFVELRVSPLRIFLKKIYVRRVEIKDTGIKFISDSTGVLNISKLFPPSEEEDTAKSTFPFRIEVADFNLTNVKFSLQRFDLVKSKAEYSSLNMDDLRVENIFLSLKAFADIDNKTFELKINHLSLSPNITGFNLKSLSGEFGVTQKEILVNELNLNTENSEITINARADGLNIFDSSFTEKLNDVVFDLYVNSSKFNFADLSSFVPPIEMLKGAVGLQLQASGKLKQLDLNKLVLDYEKTHLETKAILRNIDDVDNLTISSVFKNSYINQSDINKLLPDFGIPVFDKLGTVKIDSLSFEGKPLNFNSKLMFSAGEGKIFSNVKMNLEKAVTDYDINLVVKNFNLAPVINVSSSLNLKANFSGSGFSPKEINSTFAITGETSVLEGIKIDNFSLNARAKEGLVNFTFNTSSDSSYAEIDGTLNFLNNIIGYQATGIVRNLDLGKLMKDSTAYTNLNFSFNTEGESFDIDEFNMYLTLNVAPSSVNGTKIDSIRTITDIFTNTNQERVINFISDIADITIKGNFSLQDLISALSDETSLVTDAMLNKISEIFPSNDESNLTNKKVLLKTSKRNLKSPNSNTFVEYFVDLKDFGIISPFLQNRRLEIDGSIKGNINFNSKGIEISCISSFNYLKYWGGDDVFFIAKFFADLSVKNDFNVSSTKDIYVNLEANVNRIFAGTDIYNSFVSFKFADDKALLRLGANLENYASAKFIALAELKESTINFEIDTLEADYKGFDLKNREKINVLFSAKRIEVSTFNLFHDEGLISAEGFLASDEEQNLKIILSDIKGQDLIQSFSNGNGLNDIDINLNMNISITGDYDNPVMEAHLSGKGLTFKKKEFGNLECSFNYDDKNLSADVKFFAVSSKLSNPSLILKGNLPINLSFTESGKRINDEEEISLNLSAYNFDLTPFGEIIPGVSKFKGNLNCDLQLMGTLKEPHPNGFVKLDNSSFLLKYNNLAYNTGIKVSIAKDFFSLDSLLISNSEETKFGGKITGSGKAELDKLNITSSQFALSGSLKVLGEESKYVSPNLYGDLVISTKGNFNLTFDKDGAKLTAPISIDVAKLTYLQPQSYYSSSSENFIYRFIEDTVSKNLRAMDFDDLVNLSRLKDAEKSQQTAKPSRFDYKIDVSVEEEAVLTYVLSREFNQNLVAILQGNFTYESIAGNPVAQGELRLLEGSTLEFIKTFNAEGKIRFESELSNPYLDITAIYKNYYYPAESSSNSETDKSSSEEIEVAIKLNIKGVLNELDKNLSQQSEKLTVYVGSKNIEENVPDLTKDASDAVMFMLLGKFNDNVTQQERNIVSSYATSFAGSLVGGFLNRQLGDVVKSLEIRQSGTDTKFILAGRAGKFRYSIGGSTAVFQDLGLANVKIEYPITKSFFMRLERKEALSENKYVNEMINEIGLRYRFEF